MSDDIAAVDPSEDNQRPEWLPDNFESPEALLASYKESQKKITELSQRNSGLEDSVTQLASQFEDFTAAQNRPDPNTVYSQWQDQYEADPFSTTLSLAQAVAQQTANEILKQQQGQSAQPAVTPDVVAFIADQTMGQNHDDWNDYKAQVGELIAQNPLFQRDELWSSPQSAAQAFDTAYKMVKADAYLSGDPAVQQALADTRQMKLNAQSAVGAAGRPATPSDEAAEWAAIKEAKPKNYWE